MTARRSLFLLLLAAATCTAQTATPPPQSVEDLRNALPPSTIFEQTLRPFDATRADMANWSETEVAAMLVAVHTAHDECVRLEKVAREDEELYALARLCAVGREWNGSYSAAVRYVRNLKAPHFAQGYYLLAQADLNLQNFGVLPEHLQTMRDSMPFSRDEDEVFNYVLSSVEVARPETGIQVAKMRQAILINVIRSEKPAISAGTAEAEAVHTLELLRMANHPEAEIEQSRQEIETAVAARTVSLTPAERYEVALARRRYSMLGSPMLPFEVTHSTYPALYNAKIGDIRLFVLYPENCAGCTLLPTVVDILRNRINAVAQAWLVADASPGNEARPVAKDPAEKNPPPPPHLLTTKTPLLQQMGADASPLFVITDASGTIRFLHAGTAGWLSINPKEQGTIEVVMERVAATFGVKPVADKSSPAPR